MIVQARATKVSSCHPEEERRPEAGSRQREETSTAKAGSRSPRGEF